MLVADIIDTTGLVADTDATVTGPDELHAQIRRTRDDGVTVCREEQFEGIVGVALIETGTDECTAAPSVYG